MGPAYIQPGRKSVYLPSLDGWRAFAIMAVMLDHEPWSPRATLGLIKDSLSWGLYLFFALSGLLIVTRILDEQHRTGTFRLWPFYIRRFFRIQPAAWVYLAVVAALILGGVTRETWSSWTSSLLLYQNFRYNTLDSSQVVYQSILTSHFWTLAVEEHFYVLISVVLAFTNRRVLAVGGLLLGTLLLNRTLVHWLHAGSTRPRSTEWILPYLFFPALVAILLRHPAVLAAARRYLQPWAVFAVTPCLLLLAMAAQRSAPTLSAAALNRCAPVLFSSFTVWVVATMSHPRSWTTRFMELRGVRFIGRLSYSLYLWHILFLLPARPQTGITFAPLLLLSQAPWRYCATLTCALLSYYLVERPFIRIGSRLAAAYQPPESPRHRIPVGQRTA